MPWDKKQEDFWGGVEVYVGLPVFVFEGTVGVFIIEIVFG